MEEHDWPTTINAYPSLLQHIHSDITFFPLVISAFVSLL